MIINRSINHRAALGNAIMDRRKMEIDKNLENLLEDKDHVGIYSFLNNLPKTEKGPAFECFLEELYRGNGFLVKKLEGVMTVLPTY